MYKISIASIAQFLHTFPGKYRAARELECAMRFQPRITAPPLSDDAYRQGEAFGAWGGREAMLAETNRLRELHWRSQYAVLSARDLPPDAIKRIEAPDASVTAMPKRKRA